MDTQMYSEPNQPAQPAPSGGKAWIGWVVGLLIAVLVGGGLYYYYQYKKLPELKSQIDNLTNQVNDLKNQVSQQANQTSDTSNWQTYTNDKSGYSIKYPKDWFKNLNFDKSSPDKLSFTSFEATNQQLIGGNIPSKSGEVEVNEINLTKITLNVKTIQDYFTKVTDENESSAKKASVTGADEAYTVNFDTVHHLYARKGSILVDLQGIVSSDKDESILNTIDKILSTFQFTS